MRYVYYSGMSLSTENITRQSAVAFGTAFCKSILEVSYFQSTIIEPIDCRWFYRKIRSSSKATVTTVVSLKWNTIFFKQSRNMCLLGRSNLFSSSFCTTRTVADFRSDTRQADDRCYRPYGFRVERGVFGFASRPQRSNAFRNILFAKNSNPTTNTRNSGRFNSERIKTWLARLRRKQCKKRD